MTSCDYPEMLHCIFSLLAFLTSAHLAFLHTPAVSPANLEDHGDFQAHIWLPASVWIIFIIRWFGRCFLEISSLPFHSSGKVWWTWAHVLILWSGSNGRQKISRTAFLRKLICKLSINFLVQGQLWDSETSLSELVTRLGITWIPIAGINALVVPEGNYFRAAFYLLLSDSFRSSRMLDVNPV